MNPIRVLLADDHAMVRAGLRLLLKREPGFSVVAEAPDGRAALDWLDRNSADAAAQIARRRPETAVVMLSMHSDETYVLRCLRAGARAYVLKESAEHELIAALRAAVSGKSFFSPKVSRLLQQEHIDRLRRAGGVDTFDLLTEREREILQLYAEGLSNKEVAARLHLSLYTVETHRGNILEKLGLHGTADLILYAVRKGLIR